MISQKNLLLCSEFELPYFYRLDVAYLPSFLFAANGTHLKKKKGIAFFRLGATVLSLKSLTVHFPLTASSVRPILGTAERDEVGLANVEFNAGKSSLSVRDCASSVGGGQRTASHNPRGWRRPTHDFQCVGDKKGRG